MSWFTNILIVKIFLRDSYWSDTNICIYVERCFSKQLLFFQKERLVHYFSINTPLCHLDSSFVKPMVLFLFLLISSTCEFSFYAESVVLSFITQGQKQVPLSSSIQNVRAMSVGGGRQSLHIHPWAFSPLGESDERAVTSRGGMAALKQQSVVLLRSAGISFCCSNNPQVDLLFVLGIVVVLVADASIVFCHAVLQKHFVKDCWIFPAIDWRKHSSI